MAVSLDQRNQLENPKPRINPDDKRGGADSIFRGLSFFSGLVIIFLLIAVAAVLVWYSSQSVVTSGFRFLTSDVWDTREGAESYGAWQFIFGTLTTSFIALILAAPIAVGAAIYISEYAPRWLANPVSFLIELLAAVPSVIFGFWGLAVIAPLMFSVPTEAGAKPGGLLVFLHDTLGSVPGLSVIFGSPSTSGRSYLTAGIILAIMILPTIMSLSREIIQTVPPLQKEGMLALGATKWETINTAVLPYARGGIIGAIGLGLGRALGETMAVTLLIGGSIRQVNGNLLGSGQTMASLIATQFNDARAGLNLSAVVEVGLVLLLVSATIIAGSRLLVHFTAPDSASLRA